MSKRAENFEILIAMPARSVATGNLKSRIETLLSSLGKSSLSFVVSIELYISNSSSQPRWCRSSTPAMHRRTIPPVALSRVVIAVCNNNFSRSLHPHLLI